MIKLLDCTLRDGGYYNNWNYPRKTLEDYFRNLNKLPVDFAEIGYRSIKAGRYRGELFYSPTYILQKAEDLMPGIKKAIMLDEKDVMVKDLTALLGPCKGLVQMVRIAVAPERLDNGIALAVKARDMGFLTALNVMYASKWINDQRLIDKIKQDVKGVDYFYLVDSYGSLYPHQVQQLVSAIKPGFTIPLGFHGHNNLELALINSLTAIEAGCEIIDSTVTGMGRGAGNLKTELILIALKEKQLYDLDFDSLSSLSDLFEQLKREYHWGTNIAYMLAGAYSIPQKEVMEKMNKQRYFIGNIIQGWENYVSNNTFAKSSGYPFLAAEKNTQEVIITGGGTSVKEHIEAFGKFIELKMNEASGIRIIHSSTRFADIFGDAYPSLQYFCLFGKEGKRLESFANSRQITDNNKFIIPSTTVIQGTYIPAAISKDVFQSAEVEFAARFSDSPLALSIQSAIDLGAKTLYLYGFDGYLTQNNQSQLDLFNENQQIIDSAVKHGIELISLTPTRYQHIREVSIFQIISKI